MRQITITFTENKEKEQTETWIDFGDPATATVSENRRVEQTASAITAICAAGAEGLAVGSEDIDTLRKRAAVSSDILRSGKS